MPASYLRLQTIAILTFFLLAVSFHASDLQAQESSSKTDRYIDYYYPAPEFVEEYKLRLAPIVNMNKRRRHQFLRGIPRRLGIDARDMLNFTMFAKGNEGEKLIITILDDNHLNTIFRLRAFLASLSTQARQSKSFSSDFPSEDLTFLDLIGILGFESLVVTDGRDIAIKFNINQ